jgi:hypothetical protein
MIVRTLGVPPEAMNWYVRGEPMLARIRIGQYLAQGRRGRCGMQDFSPQADPEFPA